MFFYKLLVTRTAPILLKKAYRRKKVAFCFHFLFDWNFDLLLNFVTLNYYCDHSNEMYNLVFANCDLSVRVIKRFRYVYSIWNWVGDITVLVRGREVENFTPLWCFLLNTIHKRRIFYNDFSCKERKRTCVTFTLFLLVLITVTTK